MLTIPRIVAHRGLHDHLPENSAAAFAAAWEAGCTWCECDIQLSCDGLAVVMHDATLDGMCDRNGIIAAMTVERIREARLKGNGEPVPLLEDVLASMPTGCGLIIEVKPELSASSAGALLAQIDRFHCEVQSFHARNLALLDELRAKIPLTLLTDDAHAIGSHYPAHRRLGVHYPLAEAAGGTGRGVSAWTVNAPEDLRHVLRLNVDTIITDVPVVAREVANKMCAGQP